MSLEDGKSWSEVITAGSKQAAEFLSKFHWDVQRNTSTPIVNDYAAQMKRGEFDNSGITIGYLDGKGYLINGKHRLEALLQSGATVEFTISHIICRDEEHLKRLFGNQDVHRMRSYRDAYKAFWDEEQIGLRSQEINALGQGVRIIRDGFIHKEPGGSVISLRSRVVQKRAIEDWIPAAKLYFAAVRDCQTPELRPRFYNAAVTAIGLITCRYQPQLAETFWRRVAANDLLGNRSPEQALVTMMITTATRTIGSGGYARRVASVWNAYCENRKIGQARALFMTSPMRLIGTPYRGKVPIIPDYLSEEGPHMPDEAHYKPWQRPSRTDDSDYEEMASQAHHPETVAPEEERFTLPEYEAVAA